ncbi:MAG: thioredoxin domain-containing protein [Flavobacteriaceae bacterium]|nr:MAG: thioredoxin domain-containing protein [Flavobacteriaceae bacterium]
MPKKNYRLFFAFFVILMISCKEKNIGQEEHKFTNALIDETSPYLLQHAHNPVNWRAWSQEALDEAKKEDKLVLISIGYSSCHWCHVMEKETFEDEATAKMMNENFINIKVDREERPDVDQVYMTAVQGMTGGGGGWPLNIIALPNGKPIYGNTYHTKKQWVSVLTKVSDLYKTNPEKANKVANSVAEGIQNMNIVEPSSDFESLTKDVLHESVDNWKPKWDKKWGGNNGNQKFPTPVTLDFLLDYATITGDESVKKHVKNTLDKIATGGLYDHLAGGFYRYSIDDKWKVPHFEKMLYDNAQLISLYSKAYTVFNEPEYRNVVEETIAFLDREMKNAAGGYYAALDADSDGEEGKFYVWKEDQLKLILNADFELFSDYFNIKNKNIWEHGNYVLNKAVLDGEFIKEHKLERSAFEMKKGNWKKVLLLERAKRVRPGTDDKILTSWNSLLINGFVDAYKATGNEEYLEKAEDTFDFIKEKSFQGKVLQHTYKEGGKPNNGFLDDYAFLINASLNLYSATLNNAYLEFSNNLMSIVAVNFSDDTSGMYKYNKNEELIAKIIKIDDGARPSANAVMAHNLFLLGHINYDMKSLDKAKGMLSSMTPTMIEYAYGYSKWEGLLLQTAFPFYEVAIVGSNAEELTKEMNTLFIPNTLTTGSVVESDSPLFMNRYDEEGTYIYVCQDNACKLPVETVKEAVEQLNNF